MPECTGAGRVRGGWRGARLTGGFLRFVVVIGMCLAAPAGPALGQGQEVGQVESGFCGGLRRSDRLRDVSALGDLLFASGATASLIGIRLPDDAPWRDAALSWLRERIGRPVLVEDVSGPDRWRRMAVRLFEGAEEPTDLARMLVKRGLAVADPGSGEAACGQGLLAVEAAAREQGLGLWADGGYKAVAVSQTERLRERIGRFVIVEGRIRSVGERRERTYLNFGPDWASDFTIIIPKRVWALMLKRGLTAATLQRRAIRARGILEDWQGPALTLTLPEAIEFPGDENKRR